ncbi:hypothetical protein [Streptococcus sp. WB01_FAA12]|jgi:hypothetical protein|uniref:hypothetical protein n=1 Tax=Streptococcus sp. WB01_FAA12 TaxID=2725308 RepID=UPI00146E1B7A|nr:hypothetical protein [Streptococcus sp. WB01_FAA12]NMD84890.1 hypothetical protein [Streptococcus sp. WB01_FAA12]
MAVKTKSLDTFDSDIEKLQKQIEKIKQDRKKHEESVLLKIGRAYAQLVNLDNKDLTVEDILKNISKDVQNKKQAIKNQKSQEQNQQG